MSKSNNPIDQRLDSFYNELPEADEMEREYSDLAKIQQELNVPKAQRNDFGNYNYRSCEDIVEAVKPLLVKFHCDMYISDAIEVYTDRIYVVATVTFIDSTGKEIQTKAYAREPESKKGMDESQITGAASSYARKYALNALFLIDDVKDADTQDNSAIRKKKPNPHPNIPDEKWSEFYAQWNGKTYGRWNWWEGTKYELNKAQQEYLKKFPKEVKAD
jgi:hypothetical protein